MSVSAWTFLFVGVTFTLYLTIAWRTRVRDTRGFYVAGRGVPAAANGMATAADWMSAASFLSMAGLIATLGYTGGQYLMGWTGGYVLLALMLAPYLRKFGHYTVPDFVGSRFESTPARVVAVLCAIFISFTYVAGQMRGVGIVFSRFLSVDVDAGVLIGVVIVFVYATLGGMKGITWTQVAQFWVLITAFLVPAIAISLQLTDTPLPQVGMGSTLVDGSGAGKALLGALDDLHRELGFASYTDALRGEALLNMACVTLALMVGTAGLPHVIVRFYTVRNVAAARHSAFWALLFIALLYLTAPAVAAFSRYYQLEGLNGKTEQELPGWFTNWERTGLVLWFDDGDGKVAYRGPGQAADNEIFRRGKLGNAELGDLRLAHQRWLDSGGATGRDVRPELTERKLAGPDADILVLATPEMAKLAPWIIALVAAGGLAAALSTASGLLLVISSSVAHDVYYKLLNPAATEAQRLLVGRVVIGIAVVVAGLFGIFPPAFVGEVVAFAFGLAAATFFPILVLGIFSRRVGAIPAVSGMLVGLLFTAGYIVACVFGGMEPFLFGIRPTGIGAVGMLLNFAVTLALTPLCPPPPESVQRLIDSIREPESPGPGLDIERASEAP